MSLSQRELEKRYARAEARDRFWNEHDKEAYHCPDCGEKDAHFEVHHIDRDWSNNALENLVGLCHWCHERRHRRESIEGRLQDMRDEFTELTA